MGCAVGASETTDTSSSQLARRRTLTQSRSPSASSVKLKGAMLKMNSACIIQWVAIDPHLFNVGGRIGGNKSRVSLLSAALVICFAAQCGKALAYACNNNY